VHPNSHLETQQVKQDLGSTTANIIGLLLIIVKLIFSDASVKSPAQQILGQCRKSALA
jgi:hypothetical protein